MANPYEQFGPGIADQQPTAASVPGATPDPVGGAAPAQPEGGNPYEAMTPEPEVPAGPMPMDQFQTELSKRLSSPEGGSLEDIVNWSREVGHELLPSKALEENWMMAQDVRKSGKPAEFRAEELSPERAAALREQGQYLTADSVGAFFRGLADMATLGKGANIVAAGKAAVGSGNYEDNLRAMDAQRSVDEVLNAPTRRIGQAGGIGLSALLPFSGIRQGSGMLANGLRAGAIGGTEGAIAGTQLTPEGVDTTGTVPGALIGAGAGVAAPVVARTVSAVARPIVDRIGRGGAINALGRRLGVTPQRMAEDTARLRESGIEPTLYDVIGETGQDVVGSLARRPTTGRETMQQFGDAARTGLQDRVRRRAAQISPDGRVPDEIVTDTNLARNTNMENAMAPIRGQEVPLDANNPVWEVLATGEGRNAARAAAQLERDPATKRALMDLSRPAEVPQGAAEIQRMHDEVRAMNLSPQAEQAALAQLPPVPQGAPRTMTVDMADKLARSFNDAAEVAGRQGRAGRANVLRQYGRDVREAAASNVPAYRNALDQYGAESRLSDAVRTGEEGLARNTDEFVRDAGRLNREGIPIPRTTAEQAQLDEAIDYTMEHLGIRGDKEALMRDPNFTGQVRITLHERGLPDLITPRTGPSEVDMARAGYRRAIERRAGEGPRGALEIADSLGNAPEQQRRAAALLGDEQANFLARDMRTEAEVARNRIRNAPRTGSRTSINDADNAFVESLAGVMANPVGWKSAIVSGLRGLSKAGISDRHAAQIVELATSPAGVEQAIEQLTKAMRGNEKRARYLINAIRKTAIAPMSDRTDPQ